MRYPMEYNTIQYKVQYNTDSRSNRKKGLTFRNANGNKWRNLVQCHAGPEWLLLQRRSHIPYLYMHTKRSVTHDHDIDGEKADGESSTSQLQLMEVGWVPVLCLMGNSRGRLSWEILFCPGGHLPAMPSYPSSAVKKGFSSLQQQGSGVLLWIPVVIFAVQQLLPLSPFIHIPQDIVRTKTQSPLLTPSIVFSVFDTPPPPPFYNSLLYIPWYDRIW